MANVFNRNIFFVKEHTGIFKAANNFDILDVDTGQIILECREEKLSGFAKFFRFTKYKAMTPFHLEIRLPNVNETLIHVKRGVTFFRSQVEVTDKNGKVLGRFRQKMLSLGGAFAVLDASGKELFYVQGKWTGWEFKFMRGEQKLAYVTKKWAGLGKELFTSADNYILEIDQSVPKDSDERALIMAAVMSIDMLYKE